MNKQKYVDRLVQEWIQHGKAILGVDYDDTISPWKFDSDDDRTFYDSIIKVLITARETGAYIVIFTACNPDRHDDIRKYCMSKGLVIDSINVTPIDSIPYGKNGSKIYANLFLDDRAGLIEAVDILTRAMYTVRGIKHSPNLNDFK